MAKVNTVLGSLDTSRLGFTLPHEHVLVTSAGLPFSYPEFTRREENIEHGVKELSEAYKEGVRTIVDVTTHDLGRDIKLMKEVSRRSKVNIIACTGTWRDIPRAFWTADPDWIAPLYVREIREGIEGTSIKAGIIKVANDEGGVTPEGAIVLRAAARAHKVTGVPISTHTWAPERVGEQQIKIFKEEGVDLNKVYVGHSNDTTDVSYLEGLLKEGVWLGLDRYPGGFHSGTPQWEQRTRIVKQLIDKGWANRIMVSHDWSVILDDDRTPKARRDRLKANPYGYRFIHQKVLPMLRELGVKEETINQMQVENPRRFFEGK